MKKTILISITLLFILSLEVDLSAGERHMMMSEHMHMRHPEGTYSPPYGAYCPGYRWGWYGASRDVKSIEEARDILMEYCASVSNVKIGRIKERKRFFEAEIYDKNNNLIDRVLIDKKTGRIRSMY